jgi:hypothetical protein
MTVFNEFLNYKQASTVLSDVGGRTLIKTGNMLM